jgi:hypothetical protein
MFVVLLTYPVWSICASSRIIQQTMAIAQSSADPRKQKYFVLLIITGTRVVEYLLLLL